MGLGSAMPSGLSEEQIKSIVSEKFKPRPCQKCGKTFWEVGNIQMPDRTMKMINLRIIRCAACGYTSEW
jgi:predicted nucleic-acid-binding Zn-ribbon protein